MDLLSRHSGIIVNININIFSFAGPYSIGSSLPSVENIDKLLDHGSPPSVNSIVGGYLFCVM